MKLLFTERAVRDYSALSIKLRDLFDKQLYGLLKDIRYPSLRAKKYNKTDDIWQARVNHNYRFYFKISANTYIILTIVKHPK